MPKTYWINQEKVKKKKKKKISFSNLGANISLDLGTPTLGTNKLFLTRRFLAPRENMKDKEIPFPSLGANILLEAPTLSGNNPLHI